MNYAVYHSFKSQGVSIVDHLTASKQFELFQQKEAQAERQVTGKWSWLAPPLSPTLTDNYHHGFNNEMKDPNFYYKRTKQHLALSIKHAYGVNYEITLFRSKGHFFFLASQQIVSEPSIDRCAQSNLLEVILAVVNNKEDMGIVPIENSIEGTINMVADALAQQDIFAHGEIIINIHFGLYALPHTSLSDISTVYSIAPAISQTCNFIHQHGFNYDYVDSTIQSLDKITSTTAAIAPLGSGERLGFKALASNIEDYPHNTTRF